MKQKELQVTGKAKELSDYIFLVSDKMPKKYRFTLTNRMQNTALDGITYIYYANEIFIRSDTDKERIEERIRYQRKALTSFRLLGYLSHIALQQQAILTKQFESISQRNYVASNMLGGWINYDLKRLKGQGN